jgi:hypothetical protein
MPIRIEQDGKRGRYSPRRGSGGSLLQFLPMLLGLFGRNPRLLLLVALLAGAYMLFSKRSCNPLLSEAASSSFSAGTLFDPERYRETEIYEPLADNRKNPMPDQVSLLAYAPARKNQGRQGSCVAWASAYAARTIQEARESGRTADQCTFSPSFLYNQIALDECQGAYLPEAMKVMKGKGLAPYVDMPYDEDDCSASPTGAALRNAAEFRIDGYQRLTGSGSERLDDPAQVDMLAIKQNLSRGAPVIIGMMVGGSFMSGMLGQDMWRPEEADYAMRGFGGHAMCVVGYDDYKFDNTGGFQLMNSWGPEWGRDGIGWVSYPDFAHFTREAYGLYPMGDANAPESRTLELALGLLTRDEEGIFQREVSFTSTGEPGVFRTAGRLKKGAKEGDRFRLMVSNNLECYVYIIGEESDGSCYILFPYTPKHSPFCGITGTRLFPKDHNLFPDDTGRIDRFAVLVSDKPVDYEQMVASLNASRGTLRRRLNALEGHRNTEWKAGSGIATTLPWEKTGGILLSAVIEVQK